MKVMRLMVIVVVIAASFCAGYYLAFKNITNRNRIIKDNSRSGMAIYNLFILSKIHEAAKQGDIISVEKLIALEMKNSVDTANKGNKEISRYLSQEYAVFICGHLDELNVAEKLLVCK